MVVWNNRNKYGVKKTHSEQLERTFDSKAECRRAEELYLLEKAGAIKDLKFQIPYQLSLKPNIKIRIDFQYTETSSGRLIHEDTKGILTRDSRTKLAWLKEKHGVEVYLTS